MTAMQLDNDANESIGDGGSGCDVEGHDSVPPLSRNKFPFAINIYEHLRNFLFTNARVWTKSTCLGFLTHCGDPFLF